MPIVPRTPRPTDDASILADWLEFEALTSENGVGSLLELARQLGIAGAGDAADEGEDEPRQFVDHPKLDDVMSELEKRSNACGTGYPFEIDDSGISITRRAHWHNFSYVNLLLLSLIDCKTPVASANGALFPARLFEAVCAKAAAKYLGGEDRGAKSYHFGFPRPDKSGFFDALGLLAAAVNGERLGVLDAKQEKDEGLDVLAWIPFPDGRSNFICLFGQCATGDDWDAKNPQPAEFLAVWLKIETRAVCAAMFVPFTIESRDWTKKCQSLVIFDRCRIAKLLPTVQEGAAHDSVSALIRQLLVA